VYQKLSLWRGYHREDETSRNSFWKIIFMIKNSKNIKLACAFEKTIIIHDAREKRKRCHIWENQLRSWDLD
jgi:hypothetical protein